MAHGFPDYFGEIDLPLTVPNGGTGATSFTARGVLIGEGLSSVNATAAGDPGSLLTAQGSGADPTWEPNRLIAQTNVDEVNAGNGTAYKLVSVASGGFYQIVWSVRLNNVSGNSIELVVKAGWSGGSQEQEVVLLDTTNDLTQKSDYGGAAGSFPDPTSEIVILAVWSGAGPSDTVDLHARAIALT